MDELKKEREIIEEIDAKMARLFLERCAVSEKIARYKKEAGVAVYDPARESELLQKNLALIPLSRAGEYTVFWKNIVALSRDLQERFLREASDPPALTVDLVRKGYPVYLEKGGLSRAGAHFDLDRKVMIITDEGVPEAYGKALLSCCASGQILRLPRGEEKKSLRVYQSVIRRLLAEQFTRADALIALGGGTVGDLTGFVAATFYRGIPYYQIPTTVLAAVDAAIGGKTGLDLDNVKNAVGAYCQPSGVLIDPDLFSTLPKEDLASGLAEAVKMALTFDADLFRLFEKEDPETRLEEIIRRCLIIKKEVVEADETETGVRRALNFGHTLGHAIESASFGRLSHGACVALGMIPFCAPAVQKRLLPVLQKLGLPVEAAFDRETAIFSLRHDKKRRGDCIQTVWVPEIGRYEWRTEAVEDLCRRLFGKEGEQA